MQQIINAFIKAWGVLVLSLLPLLSGCDFFDAKPSIEKDQAELQEILEGLFVTYWKGAKISIRSIPVDETSKAIDFDEIKRKQREDLGLGKQLSRIYDWEGFLLDRDDQDKKMLGAKDFMELTKELYSLADTIRDQDEDSYSTFIEIVHHSGRILGTRPVEVPEGWNNSMEHWVFAITMESKVAPGSWKTYELNRVQPKDLPTSDLRVAANLHKGLDHMRNQWYFLADESFSQAIAEANDPNILLNEHLQGLLDDAQMNNLAAQQQFQIIARATSHLLRGFARHQSGYEELRPKAIEDIEAAIADFHSLGIDNELLWMAESYVYINNEDKENAIASLTKLESSTLMSNKERELIRETKKKILERDSDGALNFLTDRVIMYKLGWSYAQSYAKEIEWMQLLEKTEQGRQILKRFTELEQTFEKAKGYLDLDRLKAKGERLLQEIKE